MSTDGAATAPRAARANDQGHLAFLIDEPRHGGRWRRDGRVPRFRYQNLAVASLKVTATGDAHRHLRRMPWTCV